MQVSGGGLVSAGSAVVNFTDVTAAYCLIYSPSASSSGAFAIFNDRSVVDAVGLLVSHCNGTSDDGIAQGGALCAMDDSVLILSASQIHGCAVTAGSTAFGGALYARMLAYVTLTGVLISNCSLAATGKASGGGIYYHASHLTLADVMITGCQSVTKATSSLAFSMGGGLYVGATAELLRLTIVACTIDSRAVGRTGGAGFFATGSVNTIQMTAARIADCHVLNSHDCRGGGLSLDGGPTVSMRESVVERCSGTGGRAQGGAFYIRMATVYLTRVAVAGCSVNATVMYPSKSRGNGGGIFITTGSVIELDESSITGCAIRDES